MPELAIADDPQDLYESDGVSGSASATSNSLFAEPPAGALETNYVLETTFVTMPNKAVFVKATAADSPPRVFKLGSSISYRIVNWVATRVGAPPASPDTDDDKTWTLLHNQVSGMAPVVGPDGVAKSYQVSGTYIYVKADLPYTTSDDRVIGVPPIYKYSQESSTLSPEDFVSVTS